MSTKVPEKREELKNFYGQFVEAESPIFNQLPDDSVIVVAGDGSKKSLSYAATCYICKASVWMDRRDDEKLRDMKIVIICPTCYFSMEPH